MSDIKTLRVCLSKDLPGLLDRNPDYLYFTYDKLCLYSGQNLLNENFVITEEIPEEQVIGMMYIMNTDGSVHRKRDYSDIIIANIEDDSQIELLKKAGTMYYVNANRRYLDSQRRTLTLPYNNGRYELAVAAKADTEFTNNTILKFNENDNKFEMYGPSSEEFIDFSKPFRGKATESVDIKVDGPRIAAKIKISNAIGNILKLASDGLYVKPEGVVDKDTFDKWVNDVSDFKKYAQDILDNIDAELLKVTSLVTPESIKAEVMEQLISRYPDIETALENYQQVVDSLDGIEEEVMDYTSTNIISTRTTLVDKVNEHTSWDNIDDAASTYTHEVDYYNKAENYYYPEMNRTMRTAILTTAINKYIEDTPLDDASISIIGAAIALYIDDTKEE